MARRTWIVVVAAVAAVVAGLIGSFLYERSASTSASNSTAPPTTSPSQSPSSQPAAYSGWLHTSGTSIVDASGTAVQLTGLNVSGMESSNPDGSNVPGTCNSGWKAITSSQADQIAGYGFHTVRLPIAWANLEPTAPQVGSDGTLTHQWNTAYVAALDNEISLLAARQIGVILDMHQSTWSYTFTTTSSNHRPGCPGSGMPGWLNPNAANETFNRARCSFLENKTEAGVPGSAWGDFEAAWSYLASHYADNAAVIGLDTINEPNCENLNLNQFYDAVTPAMHAADPRALVIVEDRDDPSMYQVTQLPPVPDVVLSIHLHEDYWSGPGNGQPTLPYSASQALAANVQRSTGWNVPLYIGEFYAFDGAGVQEAGKNQPDSNYVADTASFLNYARQHSVSWTYWAWIAGSHRRSTTAQPWLPQPVVKAISS
jgi:Cellulase (glycosyl hydrolase family 5)